MRKFGNYPIYINHPGRWEEVRRRQRDQFVDLGDYKMMTWLDFTGKRIYEILEDRSPGPEARAYEDQVYKLLTLIGSTKIGRTLFDHMNKDVKHWIVPLDYLDKSDCQCAAYEFPGGPKEGGGVRVYFSPKDFNSVAKMWHSADDILFHELVHAYRDGKVGYFNTNFQTMNEYQSAEEFFALHMQNVYLGNRGSLRYYRSYNTLKSVSKDTAYAYFAADAEVLMAFRYYVECDALAKEVARWMQPANSFNPWRDQPVLERMYLSDPDLKGVQRLPPFGRVGLPGAPQRRS